MHDRNVIQKHSEFLVEKKKPIPAVDRLLAAEV
jgi:hypothetical protein